MTHLNHQELAVMDLTQFSYWIINTPGLLKPTPIIANPSPFSGMTALNNVDYTGNPRLGFIYQHLCCQLFKASPHYGLLAEEIQLNDQKQTLGAIDFILEDNANGFQHWEVAIKFYLLHNGLWFGPNAHDRLDKKLNHMLNHQLTMSQHPCFLNQYPNWNPIEPKVLLQGRLYINPFIDQTIPDQCLGYDIEVSQISGFWCYQSQADLIQNPLFTLEKPYWATGNVDRDELYKPLPNRFSHCQDSLGQFWVIVPEPWPNA
jgi:hypothetical protein